MKLSQYRVIAPRLNAAVEAAIAANGFKVTKLRASVDETHGTVRLTIQAADVNHKDESGQIVTPEIVRWRELADLFDLKPAWLGRTFQDGAREFTIAGLAAGRLAKVVLTSGGKSYTMKRDAVVRRMTALDAVVEGKSKAA